jgi:peroxiredoxin
VAQLRRNRVRFEKAGANLLLVGMGTPGECSDFKNKFDVPFPMVSDPEKKLYQAFELKQMPPWKALSPALALKGISAVARGHGLGIPVGDVRQLPGVFVIDRKGSVAFSWPADDPSGHPSVEEILSAVDSLRRPAK